MANHTGNSDSESSDDHPRGGDLTIPRDRTDSVQLDSQLLLKALERAEQPTITDTELAERLPWSEDEIRGQLERMSERNLVDSLKIGPGEYIWWPLVAPQLSDRCRSRVREARVALQMRGWVPFPDPSGEDIDTVRVPEFLAESLRNHPSTLIHRLGGELEKAQSEPPNYLTEVWKADCLVLTLGSYRAIVDSAVQTEVLEVLDFGHHWFVYD